MYSEAYTYFLTVFMQVFPTVMEKESSAKNWTAEIMVVNIVTDHYSSCVCGICPMWQALTMFLRHLAGRESFRACHGTNHP